MTHHSIIIVEDHLFFRKALISLLTHDTTLNIVDTFSSAEEALEQLPKLDKDKVGLALIDVSLPKMNGIELVSELEEKFPKIRCLVLSGHLNRSYVKRAMAAGARGYILKDDARAIPEAIRKVINGEIFVSETLRNYL